ncbi:amidohydrolase [Candidatus Bipolaricaulota bacterium]
MDIGRRVLVGSLLLTISVAVLAALSLAREPTLILHGGKVVPMTEEHIRHEAIAISGNHILALGSSSDVLAMAGYETTVLDLEGATVLPGIIDTHSHLLYLADWEGMDWDQAQQFAIENGITTSADMGVDPDRLESLTAYASQGALRIRSRVYMVHRFGCPGTSAFDATYKEFTAFSELAPRMTLGGLKMYAERSVCHSAPVVVALSEGRRQYLTEHGIEKGWADPELVYSQEELVRVFREANALGHQIMIHSIGDAATEACLDAFEVILDGRPNALRHTIQHNTFLRDDMLPRFEEIGVLANIQAPEPCEYAIWELFTGTENLDMVMRWRDLLDAGAFVVFGSDWPFWPLPLTSRLRALVAGETTSPSYERWNSIHSPCPGYIPQTVTCWEALRMMTADAAYGLHLDESLGTLEEGKLADMVILSANPLDVAPKDLKNLSVVATYIDGQLEYDATGIFKPADGGAQSQDGIESHGTLPGDGATSQSMSQAPEEHDGMLVLDGFSDGDLINWLGYEWVRDSWDGGSFASPVRVEQDGDDAHLLLDAVTNGGSVSISSSFRETDFSGYDGLYIILSSEADMSLGVNLISTDPEWPSGQRDTFINHEMRTSDAPTTIRVPFTAFVVEEWRRGTCPACAVDLDPSRIFHLGIEIWRSNGELRIHEVGFYRD